MVVFEAHVQKGERPKGEETKRIGGGGNNGGVFYGTFTMSSASSSSSGSKVFVLVIVASFLPLFKFFFRRDYKWRQRKPFGHPPKKCL